MHWATRLLRWTGRPLLLLRLLLRNRLRLLPLLLRLRLVLRSRLLPLLPLLLLMALLRSRPLPLPLPPQASLPQPLNLLLLLPHLPPQNRRLP